MSNFPALTATHRRLPPGTQAALAVALTTLALARPASAAAPAIATIEDLKRALASVLAGSYQAGHCSNLSEGGEPWTGTMQIGTDGKIVAPRGLVQLDMFDKRGSMVLGRRYPPYPPKMTNELFHYELKVGDEMFRIDPDKTVDHVFLEAGVSGGTGNARTGVECPAVDMSKARIAAADYDLNEVMLPIFDTRGATVTGQCRALGGRAKPRPADRSATLKVGAAGIWIDGKLLPFGEDRERRIVDTSVGGRFSDGTLNGTYYWADGSVVHMERSVLAAGRLNAPFADFGFHLPDMPEGVSFFCRPGGGLLPGGKP